MDEYAAVLHRPDGPLSFGSHHLAMLSRNITEKRYQIDALDGLRGFAALLVVMSHTSNEGMHLIPFLDFRGTGKSGVFLFFLLSSFLLSIPLLAKGSKSFSIPVMTNYWTWRWPRPTHPSA